MALFNKKTEKKEKKTRDARITKTRAAVVKGGVAHDIIRAPWFSEKALIKTEKNVYTFAVPKTATKATIASAIKEVYGVHPRAVRIVNLPAKRKALRARRGEGSRPARHKAYVTLNSGDTIQFA
jgi:large subunit ribosomal protein L23